MKTRKKKTRRDEAVKKGRRDGKGREREEEESGGGRAKERKRDKKRTRKVRKTAPLRSSKERK